MNDATTGTRTVTVEREIPFPPETIWRALTQPHLLQEWLMKTDFQPTRNHDFKFTAEWGAVECRVISVDPPKTLAYTWGAYGLESVVTWTLTPTANGTHLQVEQTGFRPDQQQAYLGAKAGWPNFLNKLEQLLARPE